MRAELLEFGQRLAIASHGTRHGPSLRVTPLSGGVALHQKSGKIIIIIIIFFKTHHKWGKSKRIKRKEWYTFVHIWYSSRKKWHGHFGILEFRPHLCGILHNRLFPYTRKIQGGLSTGVGQLPRWTQLSEPGLVWAHF